MIKTCIQCDQQFEVSAKEIDLQELVSPIIKDKNYSFQLPLRCSYCSQRNKQAWRNEQKLYYRKCDFSGEKIISLYSSDKPYKVYKEEMWASDKWDPLSFGQDYNSSKSFIDQFSKLQLAVPRRAMQQDGTNENCKFVTFGQNNKSCYLSFCCDKSENVYYSINCINLKDSISCTWCLDSELLYECVDCKKCYNTAFCQNSSECSDSYLLEDCRNCQNCISCKNLRNKEYHIYNKPVSQVEFKKYKKQLLEGDLLQEIQKFIQWKKQLPNNSIIGRNFENSSGNYLENAKNCQNCFGAWLGLEDSINCNNCGAKSKNLVDCLNSGGLSEYLYQCISVTNSYKVACSYFVKYCNSVYYSDNLRSCENCFGCIGLTHKQYCILNKQYTKDEYEKLLPEIIQKMINAGEWGTFFPVSLSPFAFNETVANEYLPLNKEQVIKLGCKWKEEETFEIYDGKLTPLPASINDVGDDIVQKILQCENCKKNYKIIASELDFHRKRNLPLPKICINCRFHNRIIKRSPNKLWDRNCAHCKKPITTSYSPDSQEIVYCEACYLKEIY